VKDPGDPSYRRAMRLPSIPLDDPEMEARVLRASGSRAVDR
jgi:hypothetical protein